MSDLPEIVVTADTRNRPDDELTLIIAGKAIAGWEEIEVTLRAEGFPNSFTVSMSAQPSVQAASIAGAPCRVLLGNNVVISGYIDRQTQSGDAAGHQIELTGRGKTCDLVDCSAEWPTGQKTDVDALEIARTIADAYGLSVALGDGASAGPAVPQWLLNFGETGAEIIQRVARNAGLLAYELADGTLVLATVGETIATSGVGYGDNLQAWSMQDSMDQRFSQIVCCRLGTDSLQELGGDDFYDVALDPNVTRHRLLYQVVEASGADDPYVYTSNKARWDVARRAGRSAMLHATVDSWRDRGGTLWTPNTLIPVDVPGNLVGALPCLSEVTFRRTSESGTTAELLLMPKAAFVPEPIVLQPAAIADVRGPDQ